MPYCGTVAVKWKKLGYESKILGSHAAHRRFRGPIAVKWKTLGYRSKILGLHAAPQALLRPHSSKMEKARLKKQ